MVYLDNAATMCANGEAYFTCKITGNPNSLHKYGRDTKDDIGAISGQIKHLIGAKKGEIIYTSGATESNNMVILGVADYLESINRKTIITSQIEHPSVLEPLKVLEERGFKIVRMPVREDGVIDMQDFEEVVDNHSDNLGMVTIQMVNGEVGSIQLIEDISIICKEYDVLLHVDATQAIGTVPLKVHKDKIDFLTFSGHKFGSYKGIGVLYVRKLKTLKPIMYGGGQQFGLRPGTVPAELIFYLHTMLSDSIEHLDLNHEFVAGLRDKFLGVLDERGVNYNVNCVGGVPNILNVSFKGVPGEALQVLLDSKEVFISTKTACCSADGELSYVLSAMGIKGERAKDAVRISFSPHNTSDEVVEAAHIICDTIENLLKAAQEMGGDKDEDNEETAPA